MAEINASFIPKKDIKARKKKRPFSANIFLLIGVIVFLTSILASIGVYLWNQQLDRSNQAALASLLDNEENYGIEAIELYIDFNNRIKAGTDVLEQHVDVVRIFEILEQDTLTAVWLSKFSFRDNGDGTVSVSANGTAPTYEYVALQADAYGENDLIEDLLISGVNQGREGSVGFGLSFSISREALLINR